jgi:glycosyltransferase involved in cell wall biosynthesis
MPDSNSQHRTSAAMTSSSTVHVLAWNDDPGKGLTAVEEIYPGCDLKLVEKKAIRQNDLRPKIRALRALRGKAFVLYFRSLDDISAPLLLVWIGLLHRCEKTVLLDEAGNSRTYSRLSGFAALPKTLCALLCDAFFLLSSLIQLSAAGSIAVQGDCDAEAEELTQMAYLFPFPHTRFEVGGAMSHVRGFLSGVRQTGASCEVYTGRKLGGHGFREVVIPASSLPFFFWEARAIAYNWTFARRVRRSLKTKPARCLYQRHGRFVTSGALLSRSLHVPLILEYNGSEIWVAQNWDPLHFQRWLRRCEEFALRTAARIVVVSEALRQELLNRGIDGNKIIVNPNGVDPNVFRPNQGGDAVRRDLGFEPGDIVACFLGTFSYWHGVPVLREAMLRLLEMMGQNAEVSRLRFLMIGDGPLKAELEAAVKPWVDRGQVVFTGSVPHQRVPGLLDSADIFLSPHIPLPNGVSFFGSPTKLFEYMAMGKSIIASNLDQIGTVLKHGTSGWLVSPGDAQDLVEAVSYLVRHPDVRQALGSHARSVALACHTWRHNAQTVIDTLQDLNMRRAVPADAQSVNDRKYGVSAGD